MTSPFRFFAPFVARAWRPLRRSWATGWLLPVALACNGATGEGDTRDSNSNWLMACEQDRDCPNGYRCFDDRCAEDCTGDGCPDLAPEETNPGGAEPEPQSSPPSQPEPALPGAPPEMVPAMSAPGPSTPGASAEPEAPPNEPEPMPAATMDVPMTAPTGAEPEPAPEPEPEETCPVVAESCPEGCITVTGSPVFPDGPCYEAVRVLGCSGAGEATTDDNCIRAEDGRVFGGISGTFAGPLVASGAYVTCSAEDRERLSAAIGTCDTVALGPECGDAFCAFGERCCDACLSQCASLDDGVVCPEEVEPERVCGASSVSYSTQMTNGIGCCDFYAILLADTEQDHCVVVEVRHEVGSEPVAESARALRGAADCWTRIGVTLAEADVVVAEGVSGTIAVNYDDGGRMSFDLVATFPEGSDIAPPMVNIAFTELAIDGAWYPAR